MTALNEVMSNSDLFEKIKDFSKPVYEDVFRSVLADVYYDELYDEGEYISPTMFVDELLNGLRTGASKVEATHGYFYMYGGDGSAWGKAFNKLNEAQLETKENRKFSITFFSHDNPFEWTTEKGIEWMRKNFEHYCETMEEIASIDSQVSEQDIYDEPEFWGDLIIEIIVQSDAQRRDAICWLEEFKKVAEDKQDHK